MERGWLKKLIPDPGERIDVSAVSGGILVFFRSPVDFPKAKDIFHAVFHTH